MVELMDLWLPILLAAAFCHVASAIIWMASPLHRHDYKDPGNAEGSILEFLKRAALAPGVYMVPWCHGKEKDPTAAEKLKTGPWAMLTVMPSAPNMGAMLGLWFLHLLIVSLFVGYIASHALPRGVEYLSVFRIAGTAALLAYAGYALPMAIWHGMPWSQVPGRIIDGIVYALLTAGTFAWLWPESLVSA